MQRDVARRAARRVARRVSWLEGANGSSARSKYVVYVFPPPPPQGLKAVGAPCPKIGQVFGEAWVPEAEAQMACPTAPKLWTF